MEAGTILGGKYRVERVLGEGGMGCVVEATHTELGSKVAIKFLLPQALENPDVVARFEREARATAALESDHVVNVTDVGSFDDGAPYLVMEFLSGCDLATGLERAGGKLPIAEAVAYAIQASLGLGDAHEAGIVHRDVKPSNLFLQSRKDRRVVVKIVDFGIAKVTENTSRDLTHGSALMGSPQYMSPEQLRDPKSADARSDIWSLGVTLFESIAGCAPFDAPSMAVVHAEILHAPTPSVRAHRPEAPAQLEDILRRCLEKDPERRFGSMLELRLALEPLALVSSTVGASFDLAPARSARPLDNLASSGLDATAFGDANPAAGTTGPGVSSRDTDVSALNPGQAAGGARLWLLAGGASVAVIVAVLVRPGAESPTPPAPPLTPSAIAAPTPAVTSPSAPRLPDPTAAREPNQADADGPDAAVGSPAQAVERGKAMPRGASEKRGTMPARPPAVGPAKPPAKRASSLDMSFD